MLLEEQKGSLTCRISVRMDGLAIINDSLAGFSRNFPSFLKKRYSFSFMIKPKPVP
jgi:hypothetical protein